MKKVTEKTQPAYALGGQYESPEKIMGVFNESSMVKIEFEVTLGACGKALGLQGLVKFTSNN